VDPLSKRGHGAAKPLAPARPRGEVVDVTRQDTDAGFLDIASGREGLYLCHLPPRTRLLIQTLNSTYRIRITEASEVCVQGGAFFPRPTAARLVGSSSVPGLRLKVGWIGIGLRIELRSRELYVVTSPVRAITTDGLEP
jgi:hypothetical protein